ncbi:hypothetical protein SUGI_0695700 [Cryptomeria japonica]|nr:hypothetical protein SUGI_0695700 [Cryptomeria japonica]
MRSASLHLAIFSKNYAQSPWCLAELSFMLKTGTQIVPVFYHIQPDDDVRYARGAFADAFSKYEVKSRHTPEKLQEWKNALYHVSYITGHIVDTEDDEVGVLKNIVNCVLKVMKTVPFVVAKHPVGLDEAVNDFERATIQSAENNHRVQIVGLWGMGGSGKTTLAKHFYNNKYKTMERFGFLFDVREAAAKGELHNKQKELLEGLGLRGVQVNSIEVGKDMLASELRSVRVLIVVDDVDDVEQLDALLPNTDSLGWGSLVVVTTREFEVLRSWGISTVYKMKPLDPHYAEQLFCWHAFLQSSPFQGFESLVKSFLNVCDGLPLSLKIFGAQLYGNSSKDYWKHQLDKISRILPKNVIGRLFNKCLVELDDNDHIRMHDHLRDLGREIANQQSPYRLWFPHQIIKIYNQTQSIRIRGISSTTAGSTSGSEEFPRCSLGGEVMVDTNRGPYSLAPSSLGLKIFQTNLRSFISLANLRVLELHEQQADSHLEELWETDSDAPVQLRGLIISGCYNFKRFPDSIGCLSHLKTVVLKSARSLRGLPKEFCLLRWLEHLQIEWCVKLSSLPDSFGNLNNLRHLGLEGCQQLSTLPHSFKDLILLEHLDLNQCDKLTLRSDILESVRKLQYVNLSGCKQLEVLPSNITNQESLRTLDLRGCRSLWEVPMNIGQLSKLRVMEIGSELLTSLPNSLGDLSSLTDLRIENCPRLESLPDSVGCLNLLENLYIIFSGVTSLPISVRQLSNLHTLAIDNSLTSELNLGTGSFTFSLCQLKWR